MSTSFDGQQGLVVVRAQVTGPSGIAVVRLALDTCTEHAAQIT